MGNFEQASYETWAPYGGAGGGLGMIGSFYSWQKAENLARKEAKLTGQSLSKYRIKEVHMIRKEIREWTP